MSFAFVTDPFNFEDDTAAMLDYGVDKVFNFFAEAGIGFAEDSMRLLDRKDKSGN